MHGRKKHQIKNVCHINKAPMPPIFMLTKDTHTHCMDKIHSLIIFKPVVYIANVLEEKQSLIKSFDLMR